jgi:peroxisome-assembly ATPase
MTSASYGRDSMWSPLPADSRKWENSSSTIGSSTQSTTRTPTPDISALEEDYAREGGYQDGRAPPRPDSPKLREHHVWGVREDWGPKAGPWGKGAKVYEGSETGESRSTLA